MQIFGFQKGKINIKLPKFNYSPGETIEGEVELTLKKNISAKEINIRIIGYERVSSGGVAAGRRGARSSRRNVLFDFIQPLDGEKEYSSDNPLNYPFQIKLPSDLLSSQGPVGGKMGTALKAFETLSGTRRRIDWYLIARLSVSGFDIKKKIKINIA